MTTAAQSYFGTRAAFVTNDPPPPRTVLTGGAAAITGSDKTALLASGANATATHGGYSSATTTCTIVSGSANSFSADVIVQETTRLYFDGSADSGDELYTEYIAPHEMTFIYSMGKWTIASSTYLPADAYSFPITQFEADYASSMPQPIAAGLTGEDPDDPTDSTLMPVYATLNSPTTQELISKGTAGALIPDGITSDSLHLSYSAMAAYCSSWWYRFNSSYPRYHEDCTNFMS